tara:strand:+ start:1590 stop:2363 length:774 start_codon:yes stop_codon:yes gene_type:complete
MRYIAFILFLSLGAIAQPRINDPLPIFSSKPIETLDKGVVGWSLSTDGQWMSEKRTIPMNLNSMDKKGRLERINKIGLDNFKELRIYPVIFGADTLVLLTKLYESGYYKYKKSQRGWQKEKKCHYFIFHKSELKKLDALKDSVVQVIKINMLDNGVVSYEYRAQIMNKVKKKVVLDKNHGYDLIVTLQPFLKDQTLRFQFYAMHKEFDEVTGVLEDFKINGKSVYGDAGLFDHLYYETDIDKFSSFFTMPESFRFKY